ncbi:MAG: putative amidohydrolase [Bacteroidota bacterium]|jgi:imidazolonepropionase-like amidohydrolase|nr:putative amidohydrolase [Bacteroidota bacterium]
MKHFFLFLIITTSPLLAQNKKRILLKNATAHIGNGQIIENSLLAIKDGKIDMISDARLVRIDMSQFDTTIDLSGKHIYPGLIAPNCILGLQEAEAVRQTSDYAEVGDYNPHIRSLIAYNAESKILETVKANGVLYTQSTPRYGVISGMSSIMATDGWNWEDAMLKADDGVHMNFPNSIQKHGWWAEPQPSEKNSKYTEQLNDLTAFFENALAYCNTKNITEKNLRFEGMKGIFDGTKNLYIHTDYVKDIISAINFSKHFNIKKMVLVGGKDSYKITKLLRENKIPVMLNRLHDLPDLPEAETDLIYKLPYLLQKDSVMFCLQNQGDMEAMNARNIAFLAGTAAAYGLTKEQALQSITLSSAKILGVDQWIGSIETGKLASIVVSDGDILDMRTNKIILAYINGRSISLTNFQNDLHKKYSNKLGIKE